MLTFKRKLILTQKQEARLISWSGVIRLVYNMGLEIKIAAWRNKQMNVSAYDLQKQLKDIKEIDWINDVPRDSLDIALINLQYTYNNFFNGAGYPKFKSKREKFYMPFRQRDNILRIDNSNINIPKIGSLKMFKDSPITGNIKTATIVKERTGWFICITTDAVKDISNKDENQVIGLDMGIAHFCTDSNGNHIENPHHFKKYEAKLRVENRSLARKKKGSNRYKKQVQRLAKTHHKISNVRKDFLHKHSTDIAKNFHLVYLEDLNIQRMLNNKLFSKNISDCAWSKFRIMLQYKTNTVAVDPKYTSQTCNECGCVNSKNRISQSEFACTNCGHLSNADVNAAKNILDKGIVLNRERKALA